MEEARSKGDNLRIPRSCTASVEKTSQYSFEGDISLPSARLADPRTG